MSACLLYHTYALKFTSQKTRNMNTGAMPNSDSLIPFPRPNRKVLELLFQRRAPVKLQWNIDPPKIMNMQHIHNWTANNKNNKIATMQIYPITTRRNGHVILGSWIITSCNRPTYCIKLLFATLHLVARKSLSNNDSATYGKRPLHGIAIFEWKRGLTCKNDIIHQHVALLCASVCEWLQIFGWIVDSYFPER